ncbi:hypothetical protein GIB67_039886 [Kingdonia uniflora]|uniref:Uncharacterized protein n=1 Tax=Kingdonia uniflora TaxID=39325 RepID=A0A7J7P3C8_9MAGN|nr:hypothetical protein GIB67_039886 [Kingdonia uniflora]
MTCYKSSLCNILVKMRNRVYHTWFSFIMEEPWIRYFGNQSSETPFAVLVKECCLKYFWVLRSVRFNGWGVCDAKFLAFNDI